MAVLKKRIPNQLLARLEQVGYDHATPVRPPSDLNDTEAVVTDVFNDLVDEVETLIGVNVSQPDWYVDSVNGNDANDGKTPATALQTILEVSRRLGVSPKLTNSVRVHLLSQTMLATDQAYFQGVSTPNFAFQFLILGSVFQGAVLGNVTASTPINHAAAGGDGFLYVTIGAIVWPAARTRIRINGGPRDGAVAYVEQPNTAAGQARCSPFYKCPPDTSFDMTLNGAIPITPLAGDEIVVETVTHFQKPGQFFQFEAALIIGNVRFDDDAAFTFTDFEMVSDFGGVTLNQCSFGDGMEVLQGVCVTNNCDHAEALNALPTPGRIIGGLVSGFFGTGALGSWVFDGDVLFSQCNVEGLTGAITPSFLFGNVGFRSSPTPCVLFFADGIARVRPFDFADGVVYGTNNQYFYRVRAATGKLLIQDIATSVNMTFTAAFALVAGDTLTTVQLYPEDNKGNIIASPAADPTTTLNADVYPISKVHTARNVCLTNQNIAAFTAAGNDGINNVGGDTVVLLAQATPSQNGPWLVQGNGQALVRPDWWQHGSPVQSGSKINVENGDVYVGAELTAYGVGKVVDADDPFLIPTKIVQQLLLVNGTVDITNVPIRDGAKVYVGTSRINPVGTANTVQYNPSVITVGELTVGAPKVTVQAEVAGGGINVADGSTLNIAIFQ